MKGAWAIAFAVLVAASAAGGDVPAHYRPPTGSAEAGLWMNSDTLEEGIKTSPLRVRDAGLESYLHGVVCRLDAQRCADVRLYVLDMPYANAVTLPNGAIQVWTGLLLHVRNEAQLAHVLGHEMTHYTRRHGLEVWVIQRDGAGVLHFLRVSAFGAARAQTQARAAGRLFEHAADAADILSLAGFLSYSRATETEADIGGLQRMAAAGYDPAEAVALWQGFADVAGARGIDGSVFFAQTHPDAQDRLAALRRAAARLSGGDHGEAAFRAAVLPFRLSWLMADIDLGQYDKSLGRIDSMLETDPTDGALLFCRGEVYRRRASAEDAPRAIAAYRAALSAGATPPAAWRGLGLVLRRMGDRVGAHDAFEQYLRAVPDPPDKAMILSYVEER